METVFFKNLPGDIQKKYRKIYQFQQAAKDPNESNHTIRIYAPKRVPAANCQCDGGQLLEIRTNITAAKQAEKIPQARIIHTVLVW